MTIDTDLFVVVGLSTALMAAPAAIGAVAEGRMPYIAALALFTGTVLVTTGIVFSPTGYSLGRVPHSFVEILARIIN